MQNVRATEILGKRIDLNDFLKIDDNGEILNINNPNYSNIKKIQIRCWLLSIKSDKIEELKILFIIKLIIKKKELWKIKYKICEFMPFNFS